MAPENIGSLYSTKMPGYDEAADIQAALRLYHYGSDEAEAYSNTNPDNIDPLSIAGHLKSIEDDVATLNVRGIGSDFTPTEPTNVPDGFIWVDSDANLATDYSIPSVEYQIDAPTTNLTNGMLWVSKGSSPLTMYVYDAEDEEWKEIGA